MRSRLALLSAALIVAATFVAPTPAAALVTFTSIAVNQNGGNCMTVPNGANTNGLQLTQVACTSAASQNFTFTPVAGTTDTYSKATIDSIRKNAGTASTDDQAQ